MKNLSEAIKYIGKNLIFVFSFALLPACFVGAFLQPFSTITFIIDYKTITVSNFGDILKPLFCISWVELLNWFLAIILFVIIMSAFLGNIENHFKSGKLNLSSTGNFINNNFLIVSTYVFIFLICYLLYKFMLALICFIIHIIFGCLGSTPTIASYILFVVIGVATLAIVAYLFAMLLIALVDTTICGYSVSTSFSDANDLISKKSWQVTLLVAIPFMVVIPLVVLGHIFGFALVANLFSVILLYIYYPTLAYTMYFDFARITRYDNVKRYYY